MGRRSKGCASGIRRCTQAKTSCVAAIPARARVHACASDVQTRPPRARRQPFGVVASPPLLAEARKSSSNYRIGARIHRADRRSGQRSFAGRLERIRSRSDDLDCAPGAQEEQEKSRAVPITTHMLAVLEEVQKRRTSQSTDAFVFPSSAHVAAPLWRSTIYQFVKRSLKLDVKITVHGFRSTLKDWCRANRFPMDWYEIQVDHVLGNKVDQAYGPDPLIEQRRGMMELYGEYLSKPAPKPKAGNVVNLADKRRSA